MSHSPDAESLAAHFRHLVLKMLKDKGKISDPMIENIMGWRHNSGFNVYCGHTLWPDETVSRENLARYIIRASFSQERMVYIPKHESSDGIAKVIYTSKDGKNRQVFDAIDWLAQLTIHIPNKHEQMARYYGYYSNKSRGLRARAEKGLNENEQGTPEIVEPQASSKAFRKNWARLIQKIYEVDPLVCPKCQGDMRIISIIDDDRVIKKILNHLGLLKTKMDDLPVNKGSPLHYANETFTETLSNDISCRLQ